MKKSIIVTKDEVTRARISDRIDQCRDGYYVTGTDFLDSHEQSMAMSEARSAGGVRVFMYGGYDACVIQQAAHQQALSPQAPCPKPRRCRSPQAPQKQPQQQPVQIYDL